jgi:hypothetical protein
VKPYYDDGTVTIYHGDYGMAFRSGMGGAFGESKITGDDDTRARDAVLWMWPETLPALVFGRWSVPRPQRTRMVLTWEKGNHVGMGDLALPWKPNTEEIYVLGDGFAGHRGSSVLRHLAIAGTVGRAQDGSRHHPTEKPVSLLRDLIAKCPTGTILDPFMGSGTTLRAAKDLGRASVGIEIEERYCEIAAKRCAQDVLDLGTAA